MSSVFGLGLERLAGLRRQSLHSFLDRGRREWRHGWGKKAKEVSYWLCAVLKVFFFLLIFTHLILKTPCGLGGGLPVVQLRKGRLREVK